MASTITGILLIYLVLAIAMVNGLKPALCGGIASVCTFVPFFIMARNRCNGIGIPEGEEPTSSLWKEDRFWAGLLSACAIFMMYYYK